MGVLLVVTRPDCCPWVVVASGLVRTVKVAWIDRYLDLTATEGRARAAATKLRLETRIGTLLGPAPTPQESGARKGSLASEPSDLTPNQHAEPSFAIDGSDLSRDQRSQFRRMAEHSDVVEEVIAREGATAWSW